MPCFPGTRAPTWLALAGRRGAVHTTRGRGVVARSLPHHVASSPLRSHDFFSLISRPSLASFDRCVDPRHATSVNAALHGVRSQRRTSCAGRALPARRSGVDNDARAMLVRSALGRVVPHHVRAAHARCHRAAQASCRSYSLSVFFYHRRGPAPCHQCRTVRRRAARWHVEDSRSLGEERPASPRPARARRGAGQQAVALRRSRRGTA